MSSPIPPSEAIEIRFSQKVVVATLLKITIALIVLHLLTVADRFILTDVRLFPNNLFDLDGEQNFPAYFSSILLLIAGALLATIALVYQQTGDRFTRHWQFLALIFLGLSIDEMLSLHEKTILPLQRLLRADGIFLYTWVVPAIGLVIALLFAYRKFLLALPTRTRNRILLAGAVYLSGSLGAEMLNALWASIHDTYTTQNPVYALLIAVEESLEMFGLVLFIGVLLSLLRSIAGELTFRFVKH